jgi:hypothetical protein
MEEEVRGVWMAVEEEVSSMRSRREAERAAVWRFLRPWDMHCLGS